MLSFHSSLALLSLPLGMLLAYLALDSCRRLARARGRWQRAIWWSVGTLSMGVVLAALRLVGMLTWLPGLPVAFEPLMGMAALAAAMFTCGWVLQMGSAARVTPLGVVGGALVLSVAGVALEYLSLVSVDIHPPPIDADWWRSVFVHACAALAIVLSVRALRASLLPSRGQGVAQWQWLRATAWLGLMLVLILHAGMAAAIVPLHLPAEAGGASRLLWLGGAVGILGLVTGLVTVILSHYWVRLMQRAQRLQGSLDQLSRRMSHLATHDPLTGLPNRASLVARIEGALVGARKGNHHLAILYLGLDGFKTINDTLGHAFGDDLLRATAHRLESQLRVGSMARVGSDEFVAVLDHMRSPESALRIVERLIESMQHDFVINGTELRVTASIGLAFHPRDGDSVEDLIAHADVAMYGAKERGRNGYRVYDSGMQTQALRALKIQHGLRTAIDDGSLVLHYQPKHDGLTGVIVGAEALARWHHPELGTVSPAEFIAVAERSGQIVRLGEWVIRESCRQLREWQRRGYPGIRIAINLSPLQLNQPGMLDSACRIVSEAGLGPGQIMFEVTESQAMQDAERTTALLREFRERGFEFAIDDFGTGYSSLAYLQKFRACQLKIDRLFIHALDDDGTEARAIITAIIALAHTLGMGVVAEGVETAGQAEQLRVLGCDQLQGFLLSLPMPPAEFERCCLDIDTAAAFTL
ncbi:MAG: EAL domain-containing protein [Xanthomonadaceae bacterium]|nr:EAL domain-containing protein [Xanthomonadaceae bacterium]